jgi:hypothetical protein
MPYSYKNSHTPDLKALSMCIGSKTKTSHSFWQNIEGIRYFQILLILNRILVDKESLNLPCLLFLSLGKVGVCNSNLSIGFRIQEQIQS